MSLLRQLILAITCLVIVLLAGNLVVSVFNARTYFYEQMKVHSQDTATALGFSISSAAQEKDLVLVGSMVDVIFDRGYYRQIIYQDLNGQVLVERNQQIEAEGVPAWFINLIEIPEPAGKAEVISGWFRLGELKVSAHTGLAYRDLWRVFNEQLWLFMFTAVLAYGLAGIALHFLLRPLRQVERQAEAICRREFTEQATLPRTRELRRMVLAMNRMVVKIRDMFREQLELTESLHRASHLDSVTGLSNRLDFDARLESFIQSERGGGEGALLLLQISDMQLYNQIQGREAGDLLLRQVAILLQPLSETWPGTIVSRRGGADFCVFVPAIERSQTESLCEDLVQKLQQIAWPDGTFPAAIGAEHVSAVTLDSQLLARADEALRRAQHQSGSGWLLAEPSGASGRPANEWQQLLSRLLDAGGLVLHYQPVCDASRALLHAEVLVRIPVDGQLQNAGRVLPLVERFGLAPKLDRCVLQKLAQVLPVPTCDLCVNLSPSTVADTGFGLWFSHFLTQYPALAARLILEVSEQVMVNHRAELTEMLARVQAQGVRVALDHFGQAGKAFNYLQALPLYSLKIDRSFIRAIDASQENQFFVKSLAQIAHSCDMMVLAEGVETDAEWQQIASLGLDGGMGYLLGHPAEDLPVDEPH